MISEVETAREAIERFFIMMMVLVAVVMVVTRPAPSKHEPGHELAGAQLVLSPFACAFSIPGHTFTMAKERQTLHDNH